MYTEIMKRAESREIPSSGDLESTLKKVLSVLENESPLIRPPCSTGEPGGLILLNPIPSIIVPDLHARIGYLTSLLLWEPPGMTRTVYQELKEGRLQVICVGDGVHAEARAVRRWQKAFEEFTGDFKKHYAMDQEMRESLGLMMMVMELKTAFPDHFHFLKGNHENIANENSDDNRSFGKFVYEGDMVTYWFRKFINTRVFETYYEFEKRLPVFAVGDRFCVTHAEPRRYHTRNELIESMTQRKTIFDLTWTGNDEAEDGSVEQYLNEYFPHDPAACMFGGHRPVSGHYRLRARGKYIQIHNPNTYNVVFIKNMQEFSIDRNIFTLPHKGVSANVQNT